MKSILSKSNWFQLYQYSQSNQLNRKKIINLINIHGKRQEFINIYNRTPEEYFKEYQYKEPEIWINVLNDLQIEGNFSL